MGLVISAEGVVVDPDKIKAVLDWPVPRTLKALRGYLGLTGYYRKFIKGYNTIAAPLTALKKKDAFLWNDTAQRAFEALEIALTSPPVLALSNFSIPFIIECDASSIRIGAVLIQKGHPIAYISQELTNLKK